MELHAAGDVLATTRRVMETDSIPGGNVAWVRDVIPHAELSDDEWSGGPMDPPATRPDLPSL